MNHRRCASLDCPYGRPVIPDEDRSDKRFCSTRCAAREAARRRKAALNCPSPVPALHKPRGS